MSEPYLPWPPAQHLEVLDEASRRLEAAVDDLDDAALAEPSHLPGWSRGHVVAHLIHNAEAFTAVTSAAIDGELRETYPGGQPARDAAIERDAGRPAAAAIAALRAAQLRLHEAWTRCSDADWQRPVRFRDGVLAHLLASRWREVEIHHCDLDVGYLPSRWSSAFSHHAIDFLLPRLAACDVGLIATDTEHTWRSTTATATLTIRGDAHRLAAWLAGRSAADELAVAGGETPRLGPWP